jgi:hypothetical protein
VVFSQPPLSMNSLVQTGMRFDYHHRNGDPHVVTAVEANKHIFAEKPSGTDPVGVRKVTLAWGKARKLKLTIQTGAQQRSQKPHLENLENVRGRPIWRHRGLLRLLDRHLVVFYRNGRKPGWGDMTWSQRNWYSASGSAAARGSDIGLLRRRLASQKRGLRQYPRSHLGRLHLPPTPFTCPAPAASAPRVRRFTGTPPGCEIAWSAVAGVHNAVARWSCRRAAILSRAAVQRQL